MVLNNIKSRELNGGFTIVELLVVIVVIGILAAITIVSYTGITAKANLSKAQGNADSIGQVLDTYAAETGYYPATSAAASAGTYAKIPSGLTLQAGATTGVNVFQYFWCGAGTSAAATGAKLVYWDATLSTPGPTSTPIYLGSNQTCTAA